MMNWAVGREYLLQTPFRRGTQALITFERENNRRIRRVSPDDEAALLKHAGPQMQLILSMALDCAAPRFCTHDVGTSRPSSRLSTSARSMPSQRRPVSCP